MPKLNVKDYRLDYRTFEAFASKVQYHSQEETRYLVDWIANHNKTRHKRDFVILPWGCQSEIVRDHTQAKDFYRPDFLLLICLDNSFIVKAVLPIEVTTFARKDDLLIKKSKLDLPSYDAITKKVTTKAMQILYIIGTNDKGHEDFCLLNSYLITQIKRQEVIPYGIGDKPSYEINKKLCIFKPLYNDRKQLLLAL